jgi:hypothetical protein
MVPDVQYEKAVLYGTKCTVKKSSVIWYHMYSIKKQLLWIRTRSDQELFGQVGSESRIIVPDPDMAFFDKEIGIIFEKNFPHFVFDHIRTVHISPGNLKNG